MKGALVAPFVFLGAAVATWASSQPSPALWALSLIVLATAWLLSGRVSPKVTPLGCAVWAYVGCTLISTAVFSRYYNPAGLFDPMFLLAGFSLGRACGPEMRGRTFALLAVGAGVLAAWGVVQVALGSARGLANFEAPSTLASVINLALAVAIVLLVLGVQSRVLEWLAMTLFAGLCATFSRGAAIALGAGLLVTLAFMRFEPLQWARARRVTAFLLAGAFAVLVATTLRPLTPNTSQAASPPGTELTNLVLPAGNSVPARLELYRVAWQSVEVPCCGIGYLGFRWVLEARRAEAPSYQEDYVTYFVHNDYLQALLELGVPGLAGLLLVVALPFVLARRRPPAERDDRRILLACLAAVAAMGVHAIGDFPFHIPLCLLLFGLLLGHSDRVLALDVAPRWRSRPARVTLIVLGAGLIALLGRPVVAEASATYGLHKWRAGEGQGAAFGLELARRFDARDWRYHLYAGQFWFSQATQTNKPDAARRAEEAFVAGIAANPSDTSNRFGRIATHIRFGSFLVAPADARTLRTWADAALALAPLNPAVVREHAELLRVIETNQ